MSQPPGNRNAVNAVEVEHGEVFHALLDQLIARYNEATGRSVKNDYFGLYHSDSAQEAH